MVCLISLSFSPLQPCKTHLTIQPKVEVAIILLVSFSFTDLSMEIAM
uniref:Uncharacterized protein n=1 Tax=Populus trichocarpa TaxID=3694 RepID=A0A3N7FJT9_POPTR